MKPGNCFRLLCRAWGSGEARITFSICLPGSKLHAGTGKCNPLLIAVPGLTPYAGRRSGSDWTGKGRPERESFTLCMTDRSESEHSHTEQRLWLRKAGGRDVVIAGIAGTLYQTNCSVNRVTRRYFSATLPSGCPSLEALFVQLLPWVSPRPDAPAIVVDHIGNHQPPVGVASTDFQFQIPPGPPLRESFRCGARRLPVPGRWESSRPR